VKGPPLGGPFVLPAPRARYHPEMPVHAPPLPASAPWLNVARPLAPEELLGRIVVLDFWTYC
jgi:hypothetical protein